MHSKFYFFLLLSLLVLASARAQQLGGRISKKESSEIIQGANISNLTQKKRNVSDMGGNYLIAAAPGDTIVFSSAGYKPDTIIVRVSILSSDYDVSLAPNITRLQNVTVTDYDKYQADSIERRNNYATLLDKKHPVKLMNEKRPGDAPGFNFSPIGYFSKGEKEKRRLKERIEKQEEDFFIDYKFPASRVSQLTGLKGDSLRIFMYRYRPTYKFCREASSQDILMYVNEKMKKFKGKKS